MKNLLEIIMPASLTVVALCFCAVLITSTGLLDEYILSDTELAQVQPFGCGVTESVPVPPAPRVLPGVDAAAVAAGDALFKGNCAQCHAVNEVVVGPALAGIRQRRPMPWITAWVKNSSKLVASGDEYAVKIFDQYQQQQMPSFQLSNAEMQAIFQYIDAIDSGSGTVLEEGDAVAYAPGDIIACQ